MSSLLYISYSSGLSEADKLAIDKLVFENRKAVIKFLKKVPRKGRLIIISTAVGVFIFFSEMGNAYAIGLTPIYQAPIMRSDSRIRSTKFVPSNVRLNVQKQDKITFTKPRELPVCIYRMDDQFLRNAEVKKLIKKVRGGSLIEAAISVVLIIFIWQIMGAGIDGFQIPIVHRNGTPIRPANGGIQGQPHHQKVGGRITFRMSNSNQCPANPVS